MGNDDVFLCGAGCFVRFQEVDQIRADSARYMQITAVGPKKWKHSSAVTNRSKERGER